MRTYQHRFQPWLIAVPVILAGIALGFFWQRSSVGALVGLMLMVVIVGILERMLHTEYRFDDDKLFVVRGRFARTTVVPLSEVTRIEHVRRRWLVQNYILIEYGHRHLVSVQPQNEQGFLNEIKKRQLHYDE